MEYVRFNRRIAVRGAAITGGNRERVLDAFGDCREVVDWSEILG